MLPEIPWFQILKLTIIFLTISIIVVRSDLKREHGDQHSIKNYPTNLLA